MDVVVTSFGSAGDFNPLLAIAHALVRRSVGVSFVANPFYEERVRATGSRFVPAGDRIDVFGVLASDRRYVDPLTGAFALWRDLAVPSIRATYPAVLETVRTVGAAAVVSHMTAYGGTWAAEAARVPSVLVTTTPWAWFSRRNPAVFGRRRLPRIVQSWQSAATSLAIGMTLGRSLQRLAGELGIGITADIMRDSARRAALNVGLWPDWLRGPSPDDPPRAVPCGFAFDPIDAPVSGDVERFLRAGTPPVVVGFGSAFILHAADRFRAAALACERIGRRCLLIGAPPDLVPATPDRMIVPSAPYARVFPHAALVVHHGGFGTSAEALRAGKPSVVTPFAFDQFDTGARLEDAKLGIWYRDAVDRPDALAAAFARALGDDALRIAAAGAAARIAAQGNGAGRAAELVSAL